MARVFFSFNNIFSRSTIALKALTFATLPASPRAGELAFISDSNSVVWGATAAGGSTNKALLMYDGTNWTVVGK